MLFSMVVKARSQHWAVETEIEPGSAFAEKGPRGFYRPAGNVAVGLLADMITGALRHARAEGLEHVLINIAAMTGFDSPGPAYRRWVARRWASTVEGALRVAVVARREHICPAKTGLLTAAEEGLHAHI